MTGWYLGPGTPGPEWWWALEHGGHPAFYARAVLPGDYAPGRRPAERHLLPLPGSGASPGVCGTCGGVPEGPSLQPVERATGDAGHLDRFRDGRQPWPPPTGEATCWLCSDPGRAADRPGRVAGRDANLCLGCEPHGKETS